MLHIDRNLVDAWHILALHHTFRLNVAEGCDLPQDAVLQMMLCAKYEYVWLNAHALQLLHRMLCRLRLEFACRMEVRDIGKVDVNHVASHLPSQLSDGFHKGGTLDVTYRAANLRDDKVEMFVLSILLDASLYLVRNVRNNLNRLAKIVAMAFLVDDCLIDAARRYRVVTGCLDVRKALIMTKVKVRLHTVCRHVALSVFVRIECAWVDVNVGVELLNGDLVATSLQQLADTRGNDAFA